MLSPPSMNRRSVESGFSTRDIRCEHFSIREETGEIEGLTEIGRATIARLRINSRAQIEARKQWLKLGLLP